MKSIAVGPAALYLNLMKDFSLMMQLWKIFHFSNLVRKQPLRVEGAFVQGIQTVVAQDIDIKPVLVSCPQHILDIHKAGS